MAILDFLVLTSCSFMLMLYLNLFFYACQNKVVNNSNYLTLAKKCIEIYLFYNSKNKISDSAVVYTNRKLFSSFTSALKGSFENQFAPILGRGKQIDFQNIILVQV